MRIRLILLLISAMVFSGLARASSQVDHLTIGLGTSEQPAPGQAFTVVCTVLSIADTLNNASVDLTLGPGLHTTTGSSTSLWQTALTPGTATQHTDTLVAATTGSFALRARVTGTTMDGLLVSEQKVLFISVSEDPDSAGVSTDYTFLSELSTITTIPDSLVTAYPYPFEQMVAEPFDSIEYGVDDDGGHDPLVTAGYITVQGKVFYQDPFNADIVPLANAFIEIMDEDLVGDDHLGFTITDSAGHFSQTVENGDAWGSADIYIKIVLKNSAVIMYTRSSGSHSAISAVLLSAMAKPVNLLPTSPGTRMTGTVSNPSCRAAFRRVCPAATRRSPSVTIGLLKPYAWMERVTASTAASFTRGFCSLGTSCSVGTCSTERGSSPMRLLSVFIGIPPAAGDTEEILDATCLRFAHLRTRHWSIRAWS